MIDRIFFAILLPLPIIVAFASLLFGVRAWRTKTPGLRRSRALAAIWLFICTGILFYCRERVRGWAGVDGGSITVFMIASAGALVAFGIAIGFIAAVGRSTRNSPLCPRCWYEMSGVEEQRPGQLICPECGTRVSAASDLIHRKRWPVLIALAVAFQLAGQFWYQVIRADHGGVQNFVPTTVLVAGMFSLPAESIIGPPSPFDATTLAGRLANNHSTGWQKSWAIGKAVDAIQRANHPDAVSRACTILNRCQYEGEIPLEAWKASVRLLCVDQVPGSGEAFAYLADCYVRARGLPAATARLSNATDPVKSADELRELAPYLIASVTRAQIRSQEWWASLRLLALAGDSAAPVIPILEQRILLEESDGGRANSAAVLAMLSPTLPDAPEAAIRAFACLPGIEQPRVLNAIARYVQPSEELAVSFRALAGCGEPTLEVAGAVALLGASQTRCEGAESLIAVLRRQATIGSPDLASIYWPVTRVPGDGASSVLLGYLKELALTASGGLRVEAMAQLSTIGRDVESRSPEVLAFLDFVGTDRNAEIAERARALATDLRTARTAQSQLRKVAVIR
ncbi:MAG: hypothetical protein ACREJD_00745 [Phycisphaerales bacterium]